MDHWKIRKRFIDTRAINNNEDDRKYRLMNWFQELQKKEKQASLEKHIE